jgi:hypothetical protein
MRYIRSPILVHVVVLYVSITFGSKTAPPAPAEGTKGESGFEFPTEGRRGGVPRRAEKNFYLYVSREVKEALEHFSGTLGAFKGLGSSCGAQTRLLLS